MAKITTIIDIGSNSMRMVVFKKSSRFAFHLINETKSRVKISQGSYFNDGYLQDLPLKRAYDCLESFVSISKSFKSRKIICVATSALRDAPNSKKFLNRVKKELHLNIKIIDGEKEAYFGGIAALNLLCNQDFMTVDIGGGSTEFCFIKNGKIHKTISLNIGTIRLKELYFNNKDIHSAKKFVLNNLTKISKDITIPKTIVGIGGTIRALSKLLIKNSNYPLNLIHGFEYNVAQMESVFNHISDSEDNTQLRKIGIKKDRCDTIREGSFIFEMIINTFNIKKVITSSVGLREGVYLSDILRTSKHKFPLNFHPSLKNLMDRFEVDNKQSAYLGLNASMLFDILKPLHKIDDKYKTLLVVSSKLHGVSVLLGLDDIFYFILNNLKYNFSHSSRVLVSFLIKFSKKSLPKSKDMELFSSLLPSFETVQWLSFMMTLNLGLNADFSKRKYKYLLRDKSLLISASDISYIVKNSIYKIETPKKINIDIR